MLDHHKYGFIYINRRSSFGYRQAMTISIAKIHVVVTLLMFVGTLLDSSHGFLVGNNVESTVGYHSRAQSTQPVIPSEQQHRLLTKTICFSNSDEMDYGDEDVDVGVEVSTASVPSFADGLH